jgi:hypothetical protein
VLIAPVGREIRKSGRSIRATRNLYSLIGTGRGDKVPIGGPGQCIDLKFPMPAVAEDLLSSIKMIAVLYCCPVTQRTIPGTGGYASFIRLPANAETWQVVLGS